MESKKEEGINWYFETFVWELKFLDERRFNRKLIAEVTGESYFAVCEQILRDGEYREAKGGNENG